MNESVAKFFDHECTDISHWGFGVFWWFFWIVPLILRDNSNTVNFLNEKFKKLLGHYEHADDVNQLVFYFTIAPLVACLGVVFIAFL